jgi:hypothetical protein
MKKKQVNPEPWYSVRCIFRHPTREKTQGQKLYEERITVWKTDSFENAVELAEEEAVAYAEDCHSDYVGLAQAYHLYEPRLKSGSEVFSLMREHTYTPQKYIDRYFEKGSEKQGTIKE